MGRHHTSALTTLPFNFNRCFVIHIEYRQGQFLVKKMLKTACRYESLQQSYEFFAKATPGNRSDGGFRIGRYDARVG